MIKVTRLNNREVVVNADQIEFLESTPETMISMTSGRKMVVKEPVDEVVRRIIEFRNRTLPVLKATAN